MKWAYAESVNVALLAVEDTLCNELPFGRVHLKAAVRGGGHRVRRGPEDVGYVQVTLFSVECTQSVHLISSIAKGQLVGILNTNQQIRRPGRTHTLLIHSLHRPDQMHKVEESAPRFDCFH